MKHLKAKDGSGSLWELEAGEWRKAEPPREILPPYHPLVVPGESWTRFYQAQLRTAQARSREKAEKALFADPRLVEPKTYRD